MIGAVVCGFSLVIAVCLVIIDKYADKVDGSAAGQLSDEDKFKFKDLLKLSGKFWMISASCILIYCTVFPF